MGAAFRSLCYPADNPAALPDGNVPGIAAKMSGDKYPESLCLQAGGMLIF